MIHLDIQTLTYMLIPVVIIATIIVLLLVAVGIMLVAEGLSRLTNWLWYKISKKETPLVDLRDFVAKAAITFLLLFLAYSILTASYEVAYKIAVSLRS